MFVTICFLNFNALDRDQLERKLCAEFHNPIPTATVASNFSVLTAIVKHSGLRKGKDESSYKDKTAAFFRVAPCNFVDTSQSCRKKKLTCSIYDSTNA
jgi:hypothetical protein